MGSDKMPSASEFQTRQQIHNSVKNQGKYIAYQICTTKPKNNINALLQTQMTERFLHADGNKVNSEIVKQGNVCRKAGCTVFYMPATDQHILTPRGNHTAIC